MKAFFKILWECKWWWIVPMVIMGALFGFLLFASNQTGDAPFIYTLF